MNSVSAPINSSPNRIGTVIIELNASVRSTARCSSLTAILRYQASSMLLCTAGRPVDKAHRFMSVCSCRIHCVGKRIVSVLGSRWARAVRRTLSPVTTSKNPKSPSAGRHAEIVFDNVCSNSSDDDNKLAAWRKICSCCTAGPLISFSIDRFIGEF
jgi:hypothetical protein